MSFTEESLLGAVQRAIKNEVDRVVAEEAEKAAVAVEKRVREAAARVVLAVFEKFEAKWDGSRLTIVVEHKKKDGARHG